jgi:16S rRNA (adenine1518-N6/adenine1519-N6)-dimethyltransferase
MKENFAADIANGKLKLVQDDILSINPADLGLEKEKYIVAANIPYYITGEILRKFLTAEVYPSRMVLLVQKEVAKRIVAADGKESILSISVKAYGEPKYIDTVPKRFFRPIPKVDSAIILIDNISKNFFRNNETNSNYAQAQNDSSAATQDERRLFRHERSDMRKSTSAVVGGAGQDFYGHIDEKWFFDIVKAGFAHKRKFLRGNLAKIIPAQTLEKLWIKKNWPVNARAETFTLNQWKNIAEEIGINPH